MRTYLLVAVRMPPRGHALDRVGVCLCCGKVAPQKYNGAQILDTEEGVVGEYRLFTCQRSECRSSYLTDFEAQPGAEFGIVTDRREWARAREASGVSVRPGVAA